MAISTDQFNVPNQAHEYRGAETYVELNRDTQEGRIDLHEDIISTDYLDVENQRDTAQRDAIDYAQPTHIETGEKPEAILQLAEAVGLRLVYSRSEVVSAQDPSFIHTVRNKKAA